MTVDRLTALDASFVWVEHPGAPVHVGAVATFEAGPLLDERGELRLDEIRERVAARLDALPRLRRRLAAVPFDLDRPRWIDDPDFDIARHVEHGTLGNRVGAIYAPLPVGIGDPDARLAAVVAAMRRLKSRPEARSMGSMLDGANVLPAGAARLLTRAVEHQPFVNLVVTNVPGPPVPLYAAGARMLEAFPVVPLGANLTVGVAVLSYDGGLTITLTADGDACPDVDVLVAGIERSLADYVA